MTFLRGPAKLAKCLRLRRPRNHKNVIAGMDFFVPTVRFRLLYVRVGDLYNRYIGREAA